jgi:2-isopropylmalate synthase
LTAHERSKLSAFGSTRRKNVRVEDDAQVQALLDSQAPTICLVAKCHAWQVTDILQTTLDENLRMIHDTVSYLTRAPYNRNVMVDMEHALDGYQYDADYALQCCRTAAAAGASCVVLCDTNGGSMPWQVETCVRAVVEAVVTDMNNDSNENDDNNNNNSEDEPRRKRIATSVGIHCHNDAGMAVANSIVAIAAGAGIVQGTINGIGERTGNADLCSIIPSLALKCQTQMTCRDNLSQLTSLSRYIDEILNRSPNMAAPYVGASAFAHKGGLHVAAMARSSKSYQHVEPKDVGNESRVLISELAGRQNIMGKFAALGIDADVASEKAVFLLKRIKQLEALGYTFEGAEASVHLMMLHASDGYCQQFRVLDYAVNVQDTHIDSASRFLKSATEKGGNTGSMARATVKVRTHRVVPNAAADVGSNDNNDNINPEDLYQERLEVGEGNGPVNALANALMKALEPVHPTLRSVELNDYKVRILNPDSATGAAVRVMIEFRDTRRDKTWTTVSADTNVISASFNALIDGLEYALLDDAELCMLDEIPTS